jgi:hypothetical protein
MTFPHPPEALAELLCSERYALRTQKEREDVIDVGYEQTGETDDELTFTVHLTTYGRSKTGKLNRGRTEKSRVLYRYDKGARDLHWRHQGEEGDRVDVHGVTRFRPKGEGTRIERDVDISVRIPLVGRAIEKIIERKFREGFSRVERQIAALLEEKPAD